jgi:hypothetical protein
MGHISERKKSALGARNASAVKLGRLAEKSRLASRIEGIESHGSLGFNHTAICKLAGGTRITYENWNKRNGSCKIAQ